MTKTEDSKPIHKIYTKIKVKLPKDPFLYLPTSYQNLGDRLPLQLFENNYCQQPLEYSKELFSPVLKITTTKSYLQSFKLLLSFEKSLNNVNSLIELIQNEPDKTFIDEVFAQLMMQSSHHNLNLWKLFLILITIYNPSKKIQPFLGAYFIRSNDDSIVELSQLCYIRLRFVTPIQNVLSIPEEAFSGKPKFGLTIAEQMFNQRKSYPYLPIPFTLYRIVGLLQKKHCHATEGMFRLNGNSQLVDVLVEDMNKGVDNLENPNLKVSINDLSSLLKTWFTSMPNPVIPVEALKAFESQVKRQSYIDFIDLLERCNQATLIYLIGFLQDMLQYSDVTKMNERNLAICFSSSILRVPDTYEPEIIKQYSTMSINFLENLILKLDTSEMFPLDDNSVQ